MTERLCLWLRRLRGEQMMTFSRMSKRTLFQIGTLPGCFRRCLSKMDVKCVHDERLSESQKISTLHLPHRMLNIFDAVLMIAIYACRQGKIRVVTDIKINSQSPDRLTTTKFKMTCSTNDAASIYPRGLGYIFW